MVQILLLAAASLSLPGQGHRALHARRGPEAPVIDRNQRICHPAQPLVLDDVGAATSVVFVLTTQRGRREGRI
jgi:hypothetical protein